MADNVLELLFSANTKELDEAKEKLAGLGKQMPTVGEGIEKLAESFKNIPGPVGLAAAAFVGIGIGLKEMVEHTIESETRLLELSEAMGVSIDKAQPFIEAMALSGIEGTKLQTSMTKLAQAVGQALQDPTGKAADAFKKLGVSQKELADGDTEQIMKDAAKGLDQYADSATKTAVIRELFGKQGPAIIAAMRDEAEMEAKASEAQAAYGTKVSEADAKSAKYFGETLKLGMTMFEGVAMSVTKSLLPGLQVLVDQFAESGKQGGVMRDVLDGLSATISVVSKAIITLLVEPVRFAVEIFKEAGVAIGASMAAIAAAAHGHLGEAKQIMSDMSHDLAKMSQDYEDAADKFENALWGTKEATDTWGDSVEEGKKKLTEYNAGAHKVSDTLEKLAIELVAQHEVWNAAGESLEKYRRAQDDVAVAAERLKIAKDGGSKQAQDEAEALMRATSADKQATSDRVAGLNSIIHLQEQYNALISHGTEVEKAKAEIEKQPGMTQQQQEQLLNEAKLIDAKKQELEVDKIVASFNAQGAKDIGAMAAAYTMTTNQLKLYNEQQKLTAQYQKEIVGKTPEQVRQIAEAYGKVYQEITLTNQQTQALNQSFTGFTAGASLGVKQLAEDTSNLNKAGLETTTKFADGLTTAFMNMGKDGSNAFKTLAAGMLTFFEQLIIKWAVVQAMTAALEAMGVSGAAVSAILTGGGAVTKSANGNAFSGGSVTPFAMGGVVNGPTMAPMALMGEAGPEAIMPLQRNAAGQLGVSMSGGGVGGSTVHNHNNIITINSNRDPHEIATEARKQAAMATNFTLNTIARAQRPGGLLHNSGQAFSR